LIDYISALNQGSPNFLLPSLVEYFNIYYNLLFMFFSMWRAGQTTGNHRPALALVWTSLLWILL